jgi:hypothetical protein
VPPMTPRIGCHHRDSSSGLSNPLLNLPVRRTLIERQKLNTCSPHWGSDVNAFGESLRAGIVLADRVISPSESGGECR